MADLEALARQGVIGGRTARIIEAGAVDCRSFDLARLVSGQVRVRTERSVISPGTEMTFLGPDATNVYLDRRWNDELRIFEPGPPSAERPLVFGYRAAGHVVESLDASVPVGHRVYGNWNHTEYTVLDGGVALAQTLPPDLDWDDGCDIGQMVPICINAVAFAEGEQRHGPVVVFGAGPVGLLTAQIARAAGAPSVTVVDRIPWRLEIAASLRLDTILADVSTDVAATLKRRHGADGIPVAFECSGSPVALHEAVRVVRRRGLVVAVGFYQGGAGALRLGDEFHHNGIRITCGQIGNLHPSHEWSSLGPRAIDLAHDGALVLGGLPRTTVAIDDIAQGIEALGRPESVLQVSISYPS